MTSLGNFWEGIILVVLGVVLGIGGTYFKADYTAESSLLIGYGMRHLSGDNGTNGVTPPAAGH